MNAKELMISSDSLDFHVRLIPKKTEKRNQKNRRITLGMILSDVIELEKSRGKLEVFLGLGNWKEIGTFKEEYMENCSDCEAYGESYLELKSKGRRIQINEKIADSGYKITNAVVKRKEHWYEKWKETPLNNVSVTEYC